MIDSTDTFFPFPSLALLPYRACLTSTLTNLCIPKVNSFIISSPELLLMSHMTSKEVDTRKEKEVREELGRRLLGCMVCISVYSTLQMKIYMYIYIYGHVLISM